jgi:hypothetical protein
MAMYFAVMRRRDYGDADDNVTGLVGRITKLIRTLS